jgi:hypothetical protein
MVRLPLPIVSPALLVAATTPALLVPLATELGRFASPPWDRSSPEWQRLDRKLSSDNATRHRTLNEDLVNKRLALLAQALTADKANRLL